MFNKSLIIDREPGSSVSTVSGYGLDDRAIEVRSPAEAKDISSNLCVQTGSGAHQASYPMGTGLFPRGVTLAPHPHPLPRLIVRTRCTSSPLKRLRGM
jgi:hypothetical protein